MGHKALMFLSTWLRNCEGIREGIFTSLKTKLSFLVIVLSVLVNCVCWQIGARAGLSGFFIDCICFVLLLLVIVFHTGYLMIRKVQMLTQLCT